MASEVIQKPSKMLALLVFALMFAPATAIDSRHKTQWTTRDTCPTKIHAVIPNRSPFGSHGIVHEAMKMCSNVTELDLSVAFVSCTEFPDGWSLPFALDGSDRYLSSPQVLSLETYDFDYSEWADIVPPRPHWSNEDGSWPYSSSSNNVVAWVTDLYYKARWYIDQAEYKFRSLLPWSDWSRWWGLGEAPRWYRWHNLPVEQRSKDNLQLWLEAMDFSKVHTLSLSDKTHKPLGKGIRLLPAALKSLRSLSITGRWVSWWAELQIWEAEPGPLPKNKLSSPRPPRALDFIMALPSSLTNLKWTESWTCEPDVFDKVLRHHGASLRDLEWTNPETVFDPRPTLSIHQLRELGKWAPGLTNLAIDLNRENQDWPFEKLKVLAQSLPKLTNLVIYLNAKYDRVQNSTIGTSSLDVSSENPWLGWTLLDAEGAAKMFKILREFKAGDKLETVTFREGDWLGYVTTGWRMGDYRLEDVRAWATCSIQREDGKLPNDEFCEAGHSEEYEDYQSRYRWYRENLSLSDSGPSHPQAYALTSI